MSSRLRGNCPLGMEGASSRCFIDFGAKEEEHISSPTGPKEPHADLIEPHLAVPQLQIGECERDYYRQLGRCNSATSLAPAATGPAAVFAPKIPLITTIHLLGDCQKGTDYSRRHLYTQLFIDNSFPQTAHFPLFPLLSAFVDFCYGLPHEANQFLYLSLGKKRTLNKMKRL